MHFGARSLADDEQLCGGGDAEDRARPERQMRRTDFTGACFGRELIEYCQTQNGISSSTSPAGCVSQAPAAARAGAFAGALARGA